MGHFCWLDGLLGSWVWNPTTTPSGILVTVVHIPVYEGYIRRMKVIFRFMQVISDKIYQK
jgi:hypothetical protein